MSKNLKVFASVLMLLPVVACAMSPRERLNFGSDYWERIDTTSSLYLRGTKAQQRLHQDVSRCIVEIRDQEEVVPLRESIPADNRGGNPADPTQVQGHLDQWDTPLREGDLRYEHLDYHDFETCMQNAGWKRVDFVTPKVSENAENVFIETLTGEEP